jgi:hypothetical protein
MFDCGNSKSRGVKKERQYSRAESVSSYETDNYRNLRARYQPSKRIDPDVLCSLLEDLTYSGRSDSRKYIKYSEPKKHKPKNCLETGITLDGGTSISQYPSGPVIDLGTSSEAVESGGDSNSNAAYSGVGVLVGDKIIFDGGNA